MFANKGRSSSMAAPSTGSSLFGGGAGGSAGGNTGFSFGNPATNNTSGTTGGGGLFGGATNNNTQPGGSGLFGGAGANTNTNTGGGLFGGSGNTTTSSGSGGLFGNANGSNNAQNASGGLFGNANNNNNTNTSTAAPGGGLFGGSNNNNNNASSSAGLFGSGTNTNNANAGGGLFGQNTSTAQGNVNTSGGLFGGQSTAQTNPSTNGGGLFGQSTNTPGGLFGVKSTSSGGLFNNANTSSTSGFGASGFGSSFNNTPNQSLMSVQSPLVTSIDNSASFSLSSSVNSSVDRGLGPLTSSRRGRNPNSTAHSLTGTPTLRHRSSRASMLSNSPFKAAASPRTALNGARASPYSVSRRRPGESNVKRAKSMFFTPNSREVLRNQQSFDSLAGGAGKFTESQVNDVKRLVINRKAQRPIESITGRTIKEQHEEEEQEVGDRHSRASSLASNSFMQGSLNTSPKFNRNVTRATFKASPHEADGKTFEMNQVAKEKGYWISPNMQQLYNMSLDQLRAVPNLTIGRKRYGQIRYNDPVDLSKIQNLGDVLGNTVIFGSSTVCVYPDDGIKAEPGNELNMPATVTLENSFAVDRRTRERIMDPSDPRIAKHIARLKKAVEHKGGEFITYDVEYGSWTFKVPHFSVWGLDSDDDDDDSDVDVEVQGEYQVQPREALQPLQGQNNDMFFVQQQQQQQPNANMFEFIPQDQQLPPLTAMQPPGHMPMQFDMMQPAVYPDILQQPEQVPPLTQDQQMDIARQLEFPSIPVDQSESVTVEDTFGNRQNGKAEGAWGMPGANFTYGSDDDDNEDDEMSEPHDVESVLNDEVEIDDFEYEEERLTSKDWIEQLTLCGNVDSPLAVANHPKPEVKKQVAGDEDQEFNAGDMDNLLFGGSHSLNKSLAHQYRQAAEKLRLPDMLARRSLAQFNPGTGKLITIDSSKDPCVQICHAESRLPPTSSSEFGSLLQMTDLEKRSNQIPLAKPRDKLSFKMLQKLYKSADNIEQKTWELASILFDETDVEIPYGYSELAVEQINEKWRRQKLSKWVETHVSDAVHADLQRDNGSDAILTHLTGHNLQEACEVAIKTSNLHLATVIPLLGSAEPGIRQDARDQIDGWFQSKSINDIPEFVRKIYELLAGNTTTAQGQPAAGTEKEVASLYLSEGLDWMRAFGLRLWYETSHVDPIAAAVQKYREAFERPGSRVAKPFFNGQGSGNFDPCFHLLSLYGSINPRLTSVLEPVSGLDFRMPWHIYNVLVGSSKKFVDEKFVGDRLSVSYACQLEAEGKWLESLFVLSHVKNNTVARRYIEIVLCSHVDEIAPMRQKLTNDLKIDNALVCQVEALKCRYEKNHLEEAYNLIDAELWEEAHNTVIKKVAPVAVIQDRPERLIELLSRFRNPNVVPNWQNGGQVYLDYARFRLGHQEDLANTDRLLASLSRVSVDNFDIRVASSIMSSYVGQRVKASGEKILGMKMSGNEYLQQTVDLSVDYFNQRLAAL